MSKNLEIEAFFYGLRTFEKTLRKVDPDLQKQLQKTVKAPLQSVRNRASRLVAAVNPDIPSGWKKPGGGAKGWGDRDKRMWDNSKVRNGIVLRKNIKTKAGFTNYYTLFNESGAGNVYEFAKNSTTTQGASFVRALNRQPTSRLIWRAWDEAGGEDVVIPALRDAIDQAIKNVESAMNAVPNGDRVGLR
jgi:hypothetical protein